MAKIYRINPSRGAYRTIERNSRTAPDWSKVRRIALEIAPERRAQLNKWIADGKRYRADEGARQ